MSLAFDPIAWTLGPYAVRWYALFALVGLSLGLWLAVREARRAELPAEELLRAAVWAIPVGILTARGAYVLNGWEFYFQRPAEIWGVPLHGLSLWGGLAGGGLAAVAVLRGDRQLRARMADAAVPGLAMGILTGRIGQFWDGVGQGLPSDLPWATHYLHQTSSVPDFGVPRHPAQLYDGLSLVAVYLLLRFIVPSGASPGRTFWTFLTLYAGVRIALGAMRLDSPFVLGLQLEQIIAVGVVLLASARALREMRTSPVKQVPATTGPFLSV